MVDDLGGSMNALARELRRRGHNTRVLSLAPDPELGFPVDLHASIDAGRELLAVADSCTRLHMVDCAFELLGPWASIIKEKIEAGQAELSLQFDGEMPRSQALAEQKAWGNKISRQWATRPVLAEQLGCDFYPPYLEIQRPGYLPVAPGTRSRETKDRRARFFYAGRFPLVQYPAVEALVEQWEDLSGGELKVLTRAEHRMVLSERRFASFTACNGVDYLSRSTLEALAAGLHVVSPFLGTWCEAYQDLAGGKAVPCLDVEQYRKCLSDVQAYLEPDLEARRWVQALLQPERWIAAFSQEAAAAARVA